MRFPAFFEVFSVVLFFKFSNAQATFNPLTNPGCSTVESIVESCGPKIGQDATITSVAFSCICYDNAGNYAPTIYDDAASTCTDYILSVYNTQGNAFVAYAAGFCTNPTFTPTGTTPVITSPTATAPGVGSVNTGPVPSPTGTTSTSVSVLPGGSISSSSSSPTKSSSASTTSVAAPATTKGNLSSFSSVSSTSSGSGSVAGGSVSSTSFKAEGVTMAAGVRDGSLWSIFGSLLAAVFVL